MLALVSAILFWWNPLALVGVGGVFTVGFAIAPIGALLEADELGGGCLDCVGIPFSPPHLLELFCLMADIVGKLRQ